MSSSRRREESADGVGESPDKVRRILPLWLMKSSNLLGDSAGPSPFKYVSIRLRNIGASEPYLSISEEEGLYDRKLVRHAETKRVSRSLGIQMTAYSPGLQASQRLLRATL